MSIGNGMVDCNIKVGDRVQVIGVASPKLDHGIPLGAIGKVVRIDYFALTLYQVYNPDWVSKDDEGILYFWDIELEGCT